MGCITSIATITGNITTASTITGALSVNATLLNTGVHAGACPIILCIDGGLSSTAVYGPVNGLLNGGSS